MGQGLQVWDALGALIVDTNVAVLRDFVSATVQNNSTSVQTVAAATPANATAVVSTSFVSTGDVNDVPPDTTFDTGTGQLKYQWSSSGGTKYATVRGLAY